MNLRPLKIVVIEDYDALREAMCDVLSGDGHDVVGVSMAEEVDDEPTGFVSDLYIIDLNLPGEDGISLAQSFEQWLTVLVNASCLPRLRRHPQSL